MGGITNGNVGVLRTMSGCTFLSPTYPIRVIRLVDNFYRISETVREKK
jgi:hypothetical protein